MLESKLEYVLLYCMYCTVVLLYILEISSINITHPPVSIQNSTFYTISRSLQKSVDNFIYIAFSSCLDV